MMINVYMLEAIKNRVSPDDIEGDLQLKWIEGQLQFLSILKTDSGQLIVRNNAKVLIPLADKKQIIDILHANHAGDKSMIGTAKGPLLVASNEG